MSTKRIDYQWWGRFFWIISLCAIVHAVVLFSRYGLNVPEIERLFCYRWKGEETWVNLPMHVTGWSAILLGPLIISVLITVANFKPDKNGKNPVLDYLGWMGFSLLFCVVVEIFTADDIGFFMAYVWLTLWWFLGYRRWLLKTILRMMRPVVRVLFPQRLGF